MKRFALLALALVGCGLEQPGFQCEEDPFLPQFLELESKPYEVVECPAGMPVLYNGKGCVPCEFYDQCGAVYDIGGCSPAKGVYCWNGTIACPGGYEIPQDQTVTEWSVSK